MRKATKSKTIVVRVTEARYRAILGAARGAGLSISDFLRESLVDRDGWKIRAERAECALDLHLGRATEGDAANGHS